MNPSPVAMITTKPRLRRAKSLILFTCLSLLTACGIIQIKHLLNLSLYSYHVERSRMESLGAWHFPSTLPKDQQQLTYHYRLDDDHQTMRLSFTPAHPEKYQPFEEHRHHDGFQSLSTISIDPSTKAVTFFHQRWRAREQQHSQNNQDWLASLAHPLTETP